MERIDQYFEGVAWKYLSTVDADRAKSNQHELGGLVKAGFKPHLGDPGSDTFRWVARFLFLAEDEDKSVGADGTVSWYDSRRAKPGRSPELRLYYDSNPVTEIITAGMFLVVAKTRSNELILIFTDAGNSAERQLRWLFGLNGTRDAFSAKSFDRRHERSSWSSLWILGQLGIDVEPADEGWLDRILQRFGEGFPTTREFSNFAREAVNEIDVTRLPDEALVSLMDTEERLFRLFERHIVEQRLAAGFDDIDIFISYSLSVQNRRKSRAGHAFEHHLAHIFTENGILYDRGVYTENRAKPDFLFPGGKEYLNAEFPVELLSMLGVKSSCKDRWRQVLSEAYRIPHKHLATLEPGISSFQTDEMQAHHLQLVVPSPIHETYTDVQQNWLLSLRDFMTHIHEQQARL